MDNQEYIRQLEERIAALENKLEQISIGGNGSVTMVQCPVHNLEMNHDCEINLENCSVGDIQTGRDCEIKLEECSVGSAINCEMDEAEDLIEELEDRLEVLQESMEELEAKMEEIEDVRIEKEMNQ